MAVRNFWIEASIEGRASLLQGGPRAKDGGMNITLYQRDNGFVAKAVHIFCFVNREGQLVTRVDVPGMGNCEVKTER